ncbi:MAG: helix-turn-helix domain-containing protein [Armatimonadota bacterium]
MHNGFEVGLVVRGGYEWHIDRHRSAVGRGDVWLFAAWEPHRWRTTVPHTEVLVALPLPQFLSDEAFAGRSWLSLFCPPPDRRPRVTTQATRRRVLTIAADLSTELARRRRDWQVSARLNVLRLLWEISRDWDPGPRADAYAGRPGDLSRVLPAIDLVYADPARAPGLPEASAACGLSRSRFTEAFRQTLGMSFHTFTARVRLWNAAKLLVTTGMSISAIALRTGFVDDSHRHRVFARTYGCTPARHRARVPSGVWPAA